MEHIYFKGMLFQWVRTETAMSLTEGGTTIQVSFGYCQIPSGNWEHTHASVKCRLHSSQQLLRIIMGQLSFDTQRRINFNACLMSALYNSYFS